MILPKSFLILFFLVSLMCSSTVGADPSGLPVIDDASIAISARRLLAEELYKRGVGLETGGDLAGAVRLWMAAANLDSMNGKIEARLQNGNSRAVISAKKFVISAVHDLRTGRNARAEGMLEIAQKISDDIDPSLKREIKGEMKAFDEDVQDN